MNKPKLLHEVRNVARLKHLSSSTEKAYVPYIRRHILFHNKRHLVEMGVAEIREFLTHLAVEQHVAASTQNTAFSALLFLYRDVLKQELAHIEGVERAKPPSEAARRVYPYRNTHDNGLYTCPQSWRTRCS